ncbi:hypothetical protein [Aliiroseovarius crassostreae]|uniref:hypothetical protein n=1 Tax=Aliiroseovarius crassostreae TaxID=154981 RepID=UPI002204A516|nr:hypothetical protein [Aliiroseovarius crassostreae]UWQ06060.1 hypothetical protein K3X22_06435 [Aliiroseovarius crassostreae]
MKKIFIRVIAALVLAACAYVTWIVLVLGHGLFSFYNMIWGEDTSHLPRVDLVTLVDLETAERIVFRNGRKGWYLIDTPSDASALTIGFYGDRLFESLFSTPHQPMYCGSERGKILWAVKDDNLIREYAFCNANRMDLTPLVAVAQPIELIDEVLPYRRAAVQIETVDRNPDDLWVTRPTLAGQFTHSLSIELPYIWESRTEQGANPRDIEANIRARLSNDLAIPDTAYHLTLTLDRTPFDLDQNVLLARPDGQVLSTNALAGIYRPVLSFLCNQDRCDQLRRTRFADISTTFRPDILDAASAAAQEVTDGLTDEVPTLTALQNTEQTVGLPQETTFRLRYISLP